MAATAVPIQLSWEVDPTLLTDTVGSELHVDVNADCNLVKTCTTALRGVQPAGRPDIKRFKYILILLLAATAAVADQADAAFRALVPLRAEHLGRHLLGVLLVVEDLEVSFLVAF